MGSSSSIYADLFMGDGSVCSLLQPGYYGSSISLRSISRVASSFSVYSSVRVAGL